MGQLSLIKLFGPSPVIYSPVKWALSWPMEVDRTRPCLVGFMYVWWANCLIYLKIFFINLIILILHSYVWWRKRNGMLQLKDNIFWVYIKSWLIWWYSFNLIIIRPLIRYYHFILFTRPCKISTFDNIKCWFLHI